MSSPQVNDMDEIEKARDDLDDCIREYGRAVFEYHPVDGGASQREQNEARDDLRKAIETHADCVRRRERERCAKIAVAYKYGDRQTCDGIAAAIREE